MNNQTTGTITCSSEINYSDHLEIRRHINLLSPIQEGLFETAFSDKKNRYQYTQAYQNNAAFIVAAEPTYAHKFCRCGIPNLVNKSGRCSKRHFCSRCSYAKYLRHWSDFEHSFFRGPFWFVTFSYTGNVGFDTAGRDSCQVHWNAIQHSLNGLMKSKTISGGLASEELAVRSFVPTSVLPHTHAVLKCESFDKDVVEQAVELVQGYQENGIGTTLTPNIQATVIDDEDAFQNQIAYLFKPIDLKTAYDSAWIRLAQENRTQASRLNSDVSEFLTGHLELTRGRIMIRRFGNMHAISREFIGTKQEPKAEPKPKTIMNIDKAMARLKQQQAAKVATTV